jgi:glyoxylase-like metal-dependent hydrolase (beta-lactamase superfamily II)
MIFEQIATGGCQSYLMGCGETHAGVLIDPNLKQMDHYLGLAARDGLRIRYVLDTHTHADHFSAARELGRVLNAKVVTHHLSPAPYADFRLCDGEILRVGEMRLTAADRRHRPHRSAHRRSRSSA